MPRKNSHAVALGRVGGIKSMAKRSKRERIDLARKAGLARAAVAKLRKGTV